MKASARTGKDDFVSSLMKSLKSFYGEKVVALGGVFLVEKGSAHLHIMVRPGTEIIKLFSCSAQLSTKFILLINVKMPTIVGILVFISIINTTSMRLKARNVFICR